MESKPPKRTIKITSIVNSEKVAKRADFPSSFEELKELAKIFVPINEKNQRYQFIEEEADREVANQEDFDLMNKEYIDKKDVIKMRINVINNELEKSEEDTLSLLNTNNNIEIDDIKFEESEEDKMKKDIKDLVQENMKSLQENIVQDIYKSIQNELNKSNLNNNNNENNNNINFNINNVSSNQDNVIHFGIKCNNCGLENIRGIRYKCSTCPEYNLCQKCEKNSEHLAHHIFIKIRKFINDENILNKIQNFNYKNKDYNYSIMDKEIIFSINNKENDTLVKQINLINNGLEDWKPGYYFKCLSDSELKGKDFELQEGVNKHENTNIDIIFENLKEKIETFKDEYNVYYQLFNDNDEAIGNITKFKVVFRN